MNKISVKIGIGLLLLIFIFVGTLLVNQRSETKSSIRFTEIDSNELKSQSEKIYSFLYQIKSIEQLEESIDKLVQFLAEKKVKSFYEEAIFRILKDEKLSDGTNVSILKLSKSFIWRMRTLTRNLDFGYVYLINRMRVFKYNSDSRAEFINVFFDYLNEPSKNVLGPTAIFKSGNDLQNYLVQFVAPVLSKKIELLEELFNKWGNVQKEIGYFDIGLMFGPRYADKIFSDQLRYLKIYPVHIKDVLSSFSLANSLIMYGSSYDLEELDNFINGISRNLVKVNPVKDDKTNPQYEELLLEHRTPKEISRDLSNIKYKSFLVIRDRAIKDDYLGQSLFYLIKFNQHRIDSIEGHLELLSFANQHEILNITGLSYQSLRLVLSGMKKELKLLLDKNQSGDYDDMFTSESITVNLKCFFSTSNPAVLDLKLIYPSLESFRVKDQQKGYDPDFFQWNFAYGKADKLKDPTLAGCFPKAKNMDDIYKSVHLMERNNPESILVLAFKFLIGSL